MKTTRVLNLNTGKFVEFYNNLSERENLISAYLIENSQTSQLLNEQVRHKLNKEIELCNGRTLKLHDFSTLDKTYIID